MKIRSITFFIDLDNSLDMARLEAAGRFISAARPAFESAGYTVQTARLATTPFPLALPALHEQGLIRYAQELEAACRPLGLDHISLGPALPDRLDSYALIPVVLEATQNTFFSGLMTRPGGGISLPAVQACAQVIHDCAIVTPDGFTNMYFAALANVLPGAPFFPAAYAGGELPSFALALEAADLAVEAFTATTHLESARLSMIERIEMHASQLVNVAQDLANQFRVAFGGLDFTLAPYPVEAISIGTAIERMGVPSVGLHGSLAAAAILTDTLDRARFPRTGFNGLMLPVLEDSTLARGAIAGTLSVKDLLLYSTVCGTGLDCVPLPGDTSVEAIRALLLDLAALSQRLAKPLTGRLMPIPGKVAGEMTDFQFDYFANSRVLGLEAVPLQRALAGSEIFTIHTR